MDKIRKSKVETVYEYCIQKIQIGEWRAGERIPSETKLNQELGISKVSIRTALQTLRTKGLIITHHGKGSFVSKYVHDDTSSNDVIVNITSKELLDITEFREAIEVKAVELCIKHATKDELSAIEDALTDMKKNTHDYIKYSKADARFHLEILKATHNQVLYHSVVSVQNEFKRCLDELNRVFVSHNLEDSYKLHKQLFHSIIEKDEKLATSLVLLNLRRNILRIKKKLSGESLNDYLYL